MNAVAFFKPCLLYADMGTVQYQVAAKKIVEPKKKKLTCTIVQLAQSGKGSKKIVRFSSSLNCNHPSFHSINYE